MRERPENPLVVAIDRSDLGEAERLAEAVSGEVGLLKVGLELFWAQGPEAVRRIGSHAPVFVDAKLHDIPNTVERAAANIARLGVAMLSVHALGGEEMMHAAVEGAARGSDEAGHTMPLVLAVTVLSSHAHRGPASAASLARLARGAGLHGVVASGEDLGSVRAACGDGFCLVVPGIRPRGVDHHDQMRVLTPREAVEAGADYLVVGRPISGSRDPAAAARALLAQLR